MTTYWKFLAGVAVIFAASYLLICVSLYFWQNRLIFLPSQVIQTIPDDFGLSYEDVWIPITTTLGMKEHLHGWWIPVADPQGVILYLHGNGSNVGANITQAQRFQEMGFSVMLIDYRGYGRSEGSFPTEQQVYEDANSALSYLLAFQQLQPEEVFLYGHSLGGAIAIELATHSPNLGGMIIQSSFTSMTDMVIHLKRYNWLPIKLILHHKFDSIAKIKAIQIPILFIHGTKDEVVPSYMTEMLYDAATATHKEILLVPDALHDNVATVAGKRYLETVEKFYETAQKSKV